MNIIWYVYNIRIVKRASQTLLIKTLGGGLQDLKKSTNELITRVAICLNGSSEKQTYYAGWFRP